MIKSVKKPPKLKKRKLSIKQLRLHNFSLGQKGEQKAISFLKQKEYFIIETNVRWKNQEVDIIALDSETNDIVFIEVKTRFNSYYGHPSQAINYKKLRSLSTTAQTYMERNQLSHNFRFDIITVLPQSIEHFTNITW